MKKEDKEAYISYRLEKADETLEVARLLVENQKWNSAINRLYYACFYAVTGLLVKSGKINKSHSGVKTQFFMDFIKSGIMPLEYGKLYGDLFDWRQKGDYGDFFDFQEKDIVPLLIPTRKFIELIKKYSSY